MRIAILGGFELVSPSGEPVRLATRKTALLLAALVLAGEKGVRREALCDAFWADRADAQARGSLRHALAALRRSFAGSAGSGIRIEGDLETIALAAEPQEVDARLFERLCGAVAPGELAAAADLYRGDILTGIALNDPLDQWFAPFQRSYRHKALQLVERLSLAADADLPGVARQCHDLAERLLASDPAAEEAHRALIRLHARQGRMTAARRQFERCKEALQRELGVEPEAQTRALLDGAGQQPAGDAVLRAPAAALALPDKPSIAVLPFQNMSGDPEQEYFADGMAEDIISALSRIRSFFVIARNSSFTYKGKAVDIKQVGRELGVRYVLEGSVRRSVHRLRVTAQLIDAQSNAHIWSDRYDGDMADVFDLQDRIAESVVGALEPTIRSAEIERARRKRPESLDAYDLVMRALPSFWAMTREANAEAVALLERAMTIDPSYAFATALCAWSYGMRAPYFWTDDPAHARDTALRLANKAAGLDSEDPFVLAILGAARSLGGQHVEAVPLIEKSLAIDPNSAFAWQRKGWLKVFLSDPDPAIACFERAMRVSPLDPYNFNAMTGIGCAHLLAERLEQAALWVTKGIAARPSATWAWRLVVAAYAALDRMDEAKEALAKFTAGNPGITVSRVAKSLVALNPALIQMQLEGLRKAGLPE